jgi:Icc-related predicted phosphoesterase
MIIAGTSDVHSPRYFDILVKAVENLQAKPDLLLLAGDITHRGSADEYQKVYNTFFGKINCPIVACFGNDEYGPEARLMIENRVTDVKFVNDESLILEINGKKVGIVGSLGSLDRPTFWQRTHLPGIYEIYKERIVTIEKILTELKADIKILLIHYCPTYKILEGENPRIYAELGCKDYERIITEQKPDIVVTGHSHKGSKKAWVDTVPVINMALPLHREIVVIDTDKDLKPGLEKFLE